MNTKTALLAAAALALVTTATATTPTQTPPRHHTPHRPTQLTREQIKNRIHASVPSHVKHDLAQRILRDHKKVRKTTTPSTTIATLDEDDEQGINPVSDIVVPIVVNLTTDLINGWQKDWQRAQKKSSKHEEDDEEQNALVDIGVGVAINVISDGIKKWEKHYKKTGRLFEEDQLDAVALLEEDEEQGFTEVIYQVIKGVLVPVATRWVEDRMGDIGRWVKTLDDDDEIQSQQIAQYVNKLSREATSFVVTKAQRETMQLYDDDDQEQILPALVWVGGVLVEVLEGVVVNIIVDKSVALGKKIFKGQKLWDEDEEEEQALVDIRPIIYPDFPTIRVGGQTWFDEESFAPITTADRKSAPLPNPEGDKKKILDKWRAAIKAGTVNTDDEIKASIRPRPQNKYKHFTPKTFDEDQEAADWNFNAGISGQVGGKPSWNVGIGAKWDEEQQLELPASRPGRFYRSNKTGFH